MKEPQYRGVNELRRMFLDFFESKGHLVMKSFSLVPHNDNSLLLINSGTVSYTHLKEAAWPKEDTVIRVSVSGTVCKEDYDTKERIAKEALDGFLAAEFDGSGLSEEITKERIWQEFAQTSFAARFLERLSDDPVKLQMAYELLQTCRETE